MRKRIKEEEKEFFPSSIKEKCIKCLTIISHHRLAHLQAAAAEDVHAQLLQVHLKAAASIPALAQLHHAQNQLGNFLRTNMPVVLQEIKPRNINIIQNILDPAVLLKQNAKLVPSVPSVGKREATRIRNIVARVLNVDRISLCQDQVQSANGVPTAIIRITVVTVMKSADTVT